MQWKYVYNNLLTEPVIISEICIEWLYQQTYSGICKQKPSTMVMKPNNDFKVKHV